MHWTLTGQVADANGRAVAGGHVRAFSVVLRDEDPIGEAVTGPDGRYAISGDRARSVRVGVYDDLGKQLAASSVRFPVGQVEDVNLVIPVAGPSSEYERYLAQLKSVLAGIPLRELSQADAEFLSGDTRIPAAHIGDLAEAARRSAADTPSPRPGLPSLPAEVWYAWQRSGVNTEPVTLWQRPTDELVATLQTAADRGVVPSAVADRIEELRPRIRTLRMDHLLDRPPVPGGGTLRDLLASAPEPLSLPDQHIVAEVLADRRPPPDRLAGDLAQAGLSSVQSTAVARTLRLAELTDGHVPVAAALQPLAGEGTLLRELATLAPENWLDLAYRYQ
ncbi:MAG: carboxypeptidase-like regulatory domain-containing protein, partial [Streptosporangiaceae bacterium]